LIVLSAYSMGVLNELFKDPASKWCM